MIALGAPPSVDRATFAAAMSEAPSRVSEMTSRWTGVPRGLVDGGEIVILAIKPSPWKPVFESAAWLVAASLLAPTLILTGRSIPGLSVATTAQIVLLIGLTRFALAVVRWITTWHLLTNRRIIDVAGVTTPNIRSCLLVRVRNTYHRCTSVEKVVGLGTITFVTDEPHDSPHRWEWIAKSDDVHARVRRAIENALDHNSL